MPRCATGGGHPPTAGGGPILQLAQSNVQLHDFRPPGPQVNALEGGEAARWKLHTRRSLAGWPR